MRQLVVAALGVAAFLSSSLQRACAADAFSWKELRINAGSAAGGGASSYDTYVRVLGRHMAKHLPGHPVFVPINRPGGGGMAMANYMFNLAARDGSEIGILTRSIPADPLVRGSQSSARFDPVMFNWIGNMNSELTVFLTWQKPPIAVQDLQSGKPLVVASTGAGSDADLYARMTAAILGAKVKVLYGYPNSEQMFLAMEGREVDAIAAISWASLMAEKRQWFDQGLAKPLLVQGLDRDRRLPDVPSLGEFAKSPVDREMINFVTTRQRFGRPVVAPPGIPKERVDILRKAFAAAMTDPEMVAEASRIGMEIDWLPGPVVENGVDLMTHTSPEVLSRLRGLFKE